MIYEFAAFDCRWKHSLWRLPNDKCGAIYRTKNLFFEKKGRKKLTNKLIHIYFNYIYISLFVNEKFLKKNV